MVESNHQNYIKLTKCCRFWLFGKGANGSPKKTENNQGLPSNLQPTESLRNLSSEIARYFRKIEDLNVRLNRTRNEGDRQIYQAKLEEMVERMSNLQVELFLLTEQLEQMMQFCESLLSQDQLQSGEDHR